MDAVRLTAPTVLQNVQNFAWGFGGAPASSVFPTRLGPAPSAVLLVVAQGGHRIAFHYPDSGSVLPSPLRGIPGFDPQVLADLLMTKAIRYEQLLDLTMGDCRLIGWPVPLTVEPVVRACGAVATDSSGRTLSEKQPQLSALNIVFALPASAAASDEARYEQILAACKSAADQLAHALRREEACGGFVSRHVFDSGGTGPDRDDVHGSGGRAASAEGGGLAAVLEAAFHALQSGR